MNVFCFYHVQKDVAIQRRVFQFKEEHPNSPILQNDNAPFQGQSLVLNDQKFWNANAEVERRNANQLINPSTIKSFRNSTIKPSNYKAIQPLLNSLRCILLSLGSFSLE